MYAWICRMVFMYCPGGVGECLDASPADSAGGGGQFFEIDFSFVVEVFEMDVAHLRDLFTQGHPPQQVFGTFPGREVPVLVGRTHREQHESTSGSNSPRGSVGYSFPESAHAFSMPK